MATAKIEYLQVQYDPVNFFSQLDVALFRLGQHLTAQSGGKGITGIGQQSLNIITGPAAGVQTVSAAVSQPEYWRP